jgi:hypothetical protein
MVKVKICLLQVIGGILLAVVRERMKVPRRIFLDAVSSSLRRWFAISMI